MRARRVCRSLARAGNTGRGPFPGTSGFISCSTGEQTLRKGNKVLCSLSHTSVAKFPFIAAASPGVDG